MRRNHNACRGKTARVDLQTQLTDNSVWSTKRTHNTSHTEEVEHTVVQLYLSM